LVLVLTQPKTSSLISEFTCPMALLASFAHPAEVFCNVSTTFSAKSPTWDVNSGTVFWTARRRMNWQRQANSPAIPRHRTNRADGDVAYVMTQRTRICRRLLLKLLAALMP